MWPYLRGRSAVVPLTVPRTRDIAERPRGPSGVAAFMTSHSKTPYITPSMDFSSRNGVVWGRRGPQLVFSLQNRVCAGYSQYYARNHMFCISHLASHVSHLLSVYHLPHHGCCCRGHNRMRTTPRATQARDATKSCASSAGPA